MKLTSAGANKMIKAWNEDLEGLLKKEEAGEKDCQEEAAGLAKVIDKQYKMAEQTMEEIYQTVKEHFVHPIQEQ